MANPIDLTAQVRAHLESLRAAGVMFVPRGEPFVIPAAPPVTERAGEPAPVAAPPLDDAAKRRLELAVLAGEVAGCDLCPELFSTRTQTVFGVGPIDPEVAFVGEAPGGDEDRQGEPFVGKAGQLLTRIIVGCGFRREDVYIFNMIKCRPPGAAGSGSSNRPPKPEECANCRPFFDRQFELVKPKHLVALGGTAAKALLNTATGITRLRGRVLEYRGVPLICTFHPSALLRDETGNMRRDVWEDMKLLLRTMGRPIPDVKKS
ncbi:MAG TPA: uracil-DNA glycosylase [Gemmata sp.]|nr:uracil-DNA glycosylase [Gemmata sp.]